MLSKLISDNYTLELKELKLIDSHFGTKIFLAQTNKGKYIVKTLPSGSEDMENEGHITEYLYNNGISVPRLLKTNIGTYHVETEKFQFHIQEFIEGETLKVNTAPEWFLEKSANIIGKVHNVLKDYRKLKTNFDGVFFDKSNVKGSINHYSEKLNDSIKVNDKKLISERIDHLERILLFDIDPSKLTYSNSHGDFHIGQIIADSENLTVIDWTAACRLPVCLDIITPYVFSSPECRDGKINGDGLKRFISNYSKYFSLNDYDIKIMPYLFYYQQIICGYSPPYDGIPETYIPICKLINNFTKWLYENVETLSKELYE